jgi:ABC-2 type transport system ATP-binding protein
VLAEVAQTVDDVVIISHGKLVAEASLGELTSRATGAVRVRTPEPVRLEGALLRAGIEFSGHDHALLVYGTTVEQVGDIAFGAGVPIHELGAESSSLEEIFLDLTAEEAA